MPVTVKLDAAPLVKDTAGGDEMARTWTVTSCVVSGPTPLLAWTVKLTTPPLVGAVPLIVAVPSFLPVPVTSCSQPGSPVTETAAGVVPPVVTDSFTFFPAATASMPVTEMVAVLDDGVTALESPEGAPVPCALVAVTVKVYVVPLVRPVTVADVAPDPTLAVIPPGDEVTVYPVIGDPPLDAGGVQVTVAEASPAVAEAAVGLPGAPTSATSVPVVAGAPSPALSVATTLKL